MINREPDKYRWVFVLGWKPAGMSQSSYGLSSYSLKLPYLKKKKDVIFFQQNDGDVAVSIRRDWRREEGKDRFRHKKQNRKKENKTRFVNNMEKTFD